MTDLLGTTYWLHGIERSQTTEAFVRAIGISEFSPCSNGHLEPGIQKIALNVNDPKAMKCQPMLPHNLGRVGGQADFFVNFLANVSRFRTAPKPPFWRGCDQPLGRP